ncbi:MAG: hypothetical protein ACEQSA_05550 [Weeksellaceae bacterium]
MSREFISIADPSGSTAINLEQRDLDQGDLFPGMDCVPIPVDAAGFITNKGIRKEVQKVAGLQENGTFPRQLQRGGILLKDQKNGGRFVEYVSDTSGNPFFLKVRGAERMLTNPRELRIVSGPCLFSVSGAEVINTDGSTTTLTMPGVAIDKEVAGLQIQEEISLYEIESLERLTRTIGEYTQGVDMPCAVAVNVPRSEYYLYALDAFNQGLMGKDIATEYFDKVDARSNRIRNLFVSRIQSNAPTADIFMSNINEPLADFVRAQVIRGLRPSLAEMLERTAATDYVASALVQVLQPQTYNQLNYLGYIYEEMINGIGVGRAAVAIENPSEEMIYVQVERMAKLFAADQTEVNTMAVYPHQQVVTEEPIKNLYFLPGAASLSTIRPVLRQYR